MRLLVGPINQDQHADLLGDLEGLDLRSFDLKAADFFFSPSEPFSALWERLPTDWQPDVVVWWSLEYAPIPPGLEACPCLLVAALADWNLNFVTTLPLLSAFDWVFTDRAGVAKLREAGCQNVSYWPNFAFYPGKYRLAPEQERPWDVTFIGNFNFVVQRERAAWLKRMARLSDRYRVSLRTQTYGEAYVRLLSQSKIVFNRSIRREMNMRAYEAPAAGALLFMEEENLEIREYLTPGIHCVLYNDQNLETLLDYYLTHDEERRQIARAGHEKIQTESYRHHFLRLVQELRQLPLASARPLARQRAPVPARLRAMHTSTLLYPGATTIAEKDFHIAFRDAPDDHETLNALGVLIARHWMGLKGEEREAKLRDAHRIVERAVTLRPQEAAYRYNLGHLLCLLGEERRGRGELLKAAAFAEQDPLEMNIDALPLFEGYDPFRVEWERASFTHVQDPDARQKAMAALLQWRAWAQVGNLWERAGRLPEACQAFTEALQGRADMGHTRSRLAALLTRLGEGEAALQEYRQAIRDAPFLVNAWTELAILLAAAGRWQECWQLSRECLAVIDACPVYEPLRARFADLIDTAQTQHPSIEDDQAGPTVTNAPQARQTPEVRPMPHPSPHGDLPMSPSARPRVLLIQLEFANWAKARSWSYIANFAIEEGLRANGVDCLTIPAIHGLPDTLAESWLSHARELCAGKQFDQVWTWLIHVEYEQSFLEWIATLAPVRVGLLMESLRYDPAAYMFAPHLRERPSLVERQIRYMTHVLAGDEHDVDEINSRGLAKALWWLNAVPERFISEGVAPAPNPAAVFYGALYGERQAWLEHPELKGLLIRPPHAPEDTTEHPRMFDALNSALIRRFQQGPPTDEVALRDYVRSLRSLRQAVFARWLEGFREWSAVVNLPTFAKFYAGRVVEGMAAGRPVISWEVPDRPQNKALFEHGKEILLYPKHNLSVLAGHIQHILQDRDFAEELAANARHTLMRSHTAEKRAQQILEWIQTGSEPTLHHGAESEHPVHHMHASTTTRTPAPPDTATHGPEDEFYVNLFVKTPHWSTPHPNPDESARWAKIRAFLEQVIHPGQQDGAEQRLRLLDLGCGRGWLTNLASAYGEPEGVDPVAGVIEHARQHFPHLRFYVGTAETVLNRPDFQPYDVVLTSEVIEHVPRDQQAAFVQNLRRLLKPHGHLILTTPRGEVLEQWKQIAPPNQPIEDWLTEHDLGHLLTSQGFRCIGCDRVYIQIPSLQFAPTPAPGDHHSPNLMPIYQVWACERLGDPVPVRPSTRRLGPMVSVIVPTYNRPETLTEALRSILDQSYQDFEIITVNDCGMDVEHVITPLNHGGRITYIKHGRNRGLGAARNTGIRVARGKYIAYLDDDDRFHHDHLETLVTFLEQHDYRVAYTDAWRLHQVREGDRYVATTKDLPYSFDFDPVTLLALNYFPVLCVMHEKACLDQAGLFDETLCTLEDWDLWIRMSRKHGFAHLKRTTAEFSWRTDGTSMTSSLRPNFLKSATIIYRKYWEHAKEVPGLLDAQRGSLQSMRANITSTLFECSIIIPIQNRREATRQCLTALGQATQGMDYEVLVVDDTCTDDPDGTLATLSGDVQIIRNSENLGFARACNQAVSAARGRYLVFLNNTTIPLDGWLKALVDEVETHPEVAVVGSKLVSPDGTIQHAGVVFGADLLPYHIYSGLDSDHPAVNHRREFPAVAAACLLVRRDAFEAVGGFDEEYRNGLEDVDLCLKLRQRGYRVVYAPESRLEHRDKGEAPTHGKDSHNAQVLHRKWQGRLRQDDVACYRADGFAVEPTSPAPGLVPKPPDRPQASVIIVAYNSLQTLPVCLESLRHGSDIPVEVIVVDNASTDGTREYLQRLGTGMVHVILNNTNLGFAKAVNQGIRASSGDHLVILNPDTQLTRGSLARMMAHVRDGVGAVGPLSNFVCGQQRVDLYLHESNGKPAGEIAGLLQQRQSGHGVETKLLVFFCTLIPRAVLDRVGLLDEDFFLNHEDFEYSLRLTRAGYRLVVATDVFVYHRGEGSKGSLAGDKNLHYIYESARVLHRKIEAIYGKGRVPTSTELWGFEIFGLDPSGETRRDLPGSVLKHYVPPESAAEEDRPSTINIRAHQERPHIALIYDNTVRPDTTGEYCKRALQQISEVVHFLPSQLQEIPARGFDLYLQIDDGFKYALPAHLRPSAWWVIDTHVNYAWDLENAKAFDFVFCAQKDGAEQFQRDGIPRVWWLPAACDPEIHKPHPVDKVYDVAFVGHLFSGPRTDLVSLIREHFPNSFVGEAYFEEMAKVYSQARIVFNRSLKNDINMRVFEALAMGSLLLTNDLSDNGQSELFQDKVHLVTYQSPGELLARISYYLDRDEEREGIAGRGWEEVLAKHTYLHRMRRVLEVCCGGEDKGNGVSGGTPRSQSREAREGLPSLAAPPKTSIVILACNQLDYSRACVESVIRHTKVPHELILVDNGSTDGTLECFRSVPPVKVVANGENLGFAAGNNRGIQAATGDYVILLNNDTIVTEGWLERMITCAESDPAIGIVGPTSNYVSGHQLDQEARYQTLEDMEAYASHVARQRAGQWIEVQRLVGFCMLIKRAVTERIGLLDERYGVGNFEDDDYCLRARQVGFRLMMARDVFIHHFGARTFVGNQIDYRQAMAHGQAHFLDKWGEKAPEAYRAYAPIPSSAVDQGMRSIQPLLRQGLELLQSGRTTEAATLFLQAARHDPTDVDALTGVAHCALAIGETELARQFLKHILALDPENEGARASLSALEGDANAEQVRVP
ncbi:MAG: glycosyltransferase [Candidatus Methylomirabilia bacterium]